MDYKEFEQYALKADGIAKANFGRYKTRVLLFALLGYGIIFAIIFAVIAMIGGLVFASVVSTALLLLLIKKKLIFVLLPMLWIMLRSLWVKIDAPSGYSLTREQYPVLFEQLDHLSTQLESLKIHQVLLTPELNAAIVQTPRLGLLGWQKNTLFLGLELLLILTPEQAKSVIAHELGHLSGNHSRFNGWIYRVRESWFRLMTGLEAQQNIGAHIIGRFFEWYAPRFSALSFPIARNNEYEADAMSAILTSKEDVGAALINVHVAAPFLEEQYWTEFFKQADECAKPKFLPWEGLNQFLVEQADSKLETRLNSQLELATSYADTHPSLTDRLAALKVEPVLPTPTTVDQSAAVAWFGDRFEEVIREFDQDWFAQNEGPWQERHRYVQESKSAWSELKAKDQNSLSDDELWKLGQIEAEFGERQDAIALFRSYRLRKADDPDGAFVLGKLLFDEGDKECVLQFKDALGAPHTAQQACWYAYTFLNDAGMTEEAESWKNLLDNVEKQVHAAENERQLLNVNDTLEKVDLSEPQVQKMIEKLRASPNVRKAWIARKVTEHYQNVSAYAVAVEGKRFGFSEDSIQQALANEFAEFEGWVIPKVGEYKPLAKKIIKAGDKVV